MDMGVLEVFLLCLLSLCSLFLFFCLVLVQITSPYPQVYRTEKEKCFLKRKNGESEHFPKLEDPWSVHLSVIVPAFDEEKRLPPMLDECLQFLENRQKENSKFKYEVIVVSDGSCDRTVDVALDYTDKYGANTVRVLALEKNRGKGGAVRLGMQSARGAVLLFADADGATKFSDLKKLENELEKLIECDYIKEEDVASRELGLVCGSRAHLEEEAVAKRTKLRNLLMHGFHALVYTLAVRSVRDTQCGFKLLTRASARQLFSSLHVQRWAFDVELLYIAEKLNIPVGEIAVNWTEIEGSKIVPVISWLQMGRDLLLIWLRYKIGAWKLVPNKSE